MSNVDAEILQDAAKLDDVSFAAIMAVMTAMAAGQDNQTAIAAGNAVLISAGRRPFSPERI